MHRISLHYALGTAAAPALIRNPLLDLLQAVSAQGSISAAARVLGLSYRHVWGELKRWEGELGQPLILGLGPKEMVMLALTFVVSALTLGGGRTTVLHGAVHLVIFAVFVYVLIVP